ncbi:caspase-8 [Hippocampus zosterae]|uniref:caspase-8 n=1 Tax=Hippocampus zosterae TaxID=109293 RepID=UPI00223E207F|nr:caspase-8 [Hippocampus zosterae]
MERQKLMEISEALASSEVAALCFLCRDVLNCQHLEGVKDAKVLFNRLEERDCLNPEFLHQLLRTIGRKDLLSLLKGSRQNVEETDANPVGKLSNYRVMLYQIYDETTKKDLQKMKFLLNNTLGRRKMDECNTALDVFVELEKVGLLSQSDLQELRSILMEVNLQLASTVEQFTQGASLEGASPPPALPLNGFQHVNNSPLESISETGDSSGHFPSGAETNPEPSSLSDQTEYYAMNRIPHGLCIIINNEEFSGNELKKRGGTQADERALDSLFSKFGFQVIVHNNLTAEEIRMELNTIATRNFSEDDALVVCLLSHGDNGCVYGTDGKVVSLRELTQPFTSGFAPTLAGKPKLYFIQACQGKALQTGSLPWSSKPRGVAEDTLSQLETDAGPIQEETVASEADFLLGMATVPDCKSFRNTTTGSIYIQELCKQLRRSAMSPQGKDILTVLTRVNREVSRGVFKNGKQMPQPKYTLTKTLILRFVDEDQVKLS